MIAMILAAGRGERLRPITDEIPKPMVEVGGQALLERHLVLLADAGVDTVVINLGWHGEKIVERIGSGQQFGVQVLYSPEYDNILETGGGICRALPMLGDEPFWVVNGDVLTDFSVRKPDLPVDCNAHLLLVPRPDYLDHGDFDLDGARVSNGPERPYTFSGIACYRPSFFAGREPVRFPLAPLLRDAADGGRLSGEIYAGLWADVGTTERLAELNRQL